MGLVSIAACSTTANEPAPPATSAAAPPAPATPDDAGLQAVDTADVTAPPARVPKAPHCVNPKPPVSTVPAPAAAAAGSFFAKHPLPSVTNGGGPTLKNPRLLPLFYKGDEMREDLEDFVGGIGCTKYWHALHDEYGVGEATAAPAFELDGAAPKKVTDDQIVGMLQKLVNDAPPGLEPATSDTVFVLFLPSSTVVSDPTLGGVSCDAFGGYHKSVVLSPGLEVAYAVVPRCEGFLSLSGLDEVTTCASHELTEAAVDPMPYTNAGFSYAQPLAWSYMLGGETADLCAQSTAPYKPEGFPFMVSRAYSTNAATAGGDPCVPVPAQNDYVWAAPSILHQIDAFGSDEPGVKVQAGTSVTVPVDLFASSGAGEVIVEVRNFSQVLGMANASTAALDHPSGNHGDTLTLTITSPAIVPANELFVLVAHRPGSEDSRFWPVLVGH